jgi:hypothetical protein
MVVEPRLQVLRDRIEGVDLFQRQHDHPVGLAVGVVLRVLRVIQVDPLVGGVDCVEALPCGLGGLLGEPAVDDLAVDAALVDVVAPGDGAA